MKRPKKFYRRGFLNQKGHQTTAYYLIQVVSRETSTRKDVDVTFRLGDCDRHVDFMFDLYGKPANSQEAENKPLCTLPQYAWWLEQRR